MYGYVNVNNRELNINIFMYFYIDLLLYMCNFIVYFFVDCFWFVG